jgi:hypothetical protein
MDVTKLKLGKQPAKIDSRTLQLRNYLTPDLPAPPDSISWYGDVTSYGSMLNDQLGDCTCAAVGHAIQVASMNTHVGEVTPPDSAVLALYEQACGYIPGDPSTDQGGIIIDVLNYVRKNLFDTHKLWAYADPDPKDAMHIKQSVALFGIVDMGLQLPISAQGQVGTLWDVVGDPNTDENSQPGSWGRHSVIVAAYDAEGLTCVTWGALQKMTWKFWDVYTDESHALLLNIWLEKYGVKITSIITAMENDLLAVTA